MPTCAAGPALPASGGTPHRPARRARPGERRFSIERDVLKLALQHPATLAELWADLEGDDFTHPYYRALFDSHRRRRRPAGGRPPEQVRADVVDDVTGVAVGTDCGADAGVRRARRPARRAYVVRLRELTALRRIEQVKSKLQRTNPVTEATDYNRMFGELVALESHRRGAAGAGDRVRTQARLARLASPSQTP